jgi:hypothetical protein
MRPADRLQPIDTVRPFQMPPPNDPLQAYDAAGAPEYDRVYAKPERQPGLRKIERWLPRVFAGRCVLEVACGTG